MLIESDELKAYIENGFECQKFKDTAIWKINNFVHLKEVRERQNGSNNQNR